MKTKSVLNLGKELSKNHQKRIMGGVTVYCTGGSFVMGSSCAGQSAYCAAAGHGTYITCF